ncbi:hypothetical protein Golob_002561, partial [Gossypium lobatum]|nr:hypothetical protein [Gossypium lobatum]
MIDDKSDIHAYIKDCQWLSKGFQTCKFIFGHQSENGWKEIDRRAYLFEIWWVVMQIGEMKSLERNG